MRLDQLDAQAPVWGPQASARAHLGEPTAATASAQDQQFASLASHWPRPALLGSGLRGRLAVGLTTDFSYRIHIMKIAIPLTGGRLSDHFGHCEQFALIEMDPVSKQILAQTLVVPPPHEPGVLPRWLHQQGVQAVIAGGMGRRALDLFAQNDIAVHAGTAGGAPEELARAFVNGGLGGGTPSCGHDHTHCSDPHAAH